jgi:DNA repair protein RecO (recombination protein O)
VKNQPERALVLRRFPWSESSLVVHVLTREHGRVNLLAKGAYRPKSRFFAVLDLFDELELVWTGAQERELKTLVEGELLVRRAGISRDLGCYEVGVAILELAHLGSRPEKNERELFDLVTKTMDGLESRARKGGGKSAERLRVEFELGFLKLHGLAPALLGCASCGGSAPPVAAEGAGKARAWFSAGAGGRLCGTCAGEARASGRRVGTLPLDVLAEADRMYLAKDQANDHALPEERLERVRDFVERFLDYQLELRPRSHQKFLEHANRNSP